MLSVGRTVKGEIHLVFLCAERTMQLHSRTAIGADKLCTVDVLFFRQIVVLAAVRFGFLGCNTIDFLHSIEKLLLDDRLMRIVSDNPIFLIHTAVRNTFVQALCCLSLCHVSDIGNVLQNIGNNVLVPENFALLLIVVGYDATVGFVLSGRRYIHFVELSVDTHIAHTLAAPQKNLLNDRSGFGVHNQAVLIVGVF